MKNDRIIVKEVGKEPEERRIDLQDLKQLQEIVGGCIQTVMMPHNILMVVNEEGRILDLPINMVFVNQVIYGNAFYCSYGGGDFTGLNEEQAEWLMSFHK